jgi:fumarate hydratase class II
MSGVRKETHSLGEVDVPADKLWGAQTQRAGSTPRPRQHGTVLERPATAG